MTRTPSYPLSGGDAPPRSANAEMLAKLAEAKARHPEDATRREMLRDPAVRDVAYALLAANEAWVNAQVKKFRGRRTFADAKSLAVAGSGGPDADAGGALGAILAYDYGDYGTAAFTPYLGTAIRNALTVRGREFTEAEATRPLPRETEGQRWIDRRGREAAEVAIDAELLTKLEEAVGAMAGNDGEVARFLIGYATERGELPTNQEIADAQAPRVTRQMGELLKKRAIAALTRKIEELNPGLAEDGVGGWGELKAAFGVHKHAGVGV